MPSVSTINDLHNWKPQRDDESKPHRAVWIHHHQLFKLPVSPSVIVYGALCLKVGEKTQELLLKKHVIPY